MANRRTSTTRQDPAADGREAIPGAAPGEVARPRLLEHLRASSARPGLVLVSAPAGYGKTTLLAQMARASEVPVVWIAFRPGPQGTRRPPAALEAALAEVRGPVLVVVDDLDLASRSAVAAVAGLIADLPAEATVALGCRADRGLLLGRRMVEGGLVRIAAADLAFDEREAEALMADAGLALDPDALADLLAHTEGWPAGLRLAALRIVGAPDPSAAAHAFAGDDRIVADYLREVVLDGLSPETLTFLRRTAPLERLSGDLCDATLGTSGSAVRLLELERSNLMLVSLDATGEEFRYHRLLGDLLRSELRRGEPEIVPELHRRAGRWHEAAGDGEAAIRHALVSGDSSHAVDLLWSGFPAALTRGGIASLQAMLAGFGIDQVVASAPLSAASAWFYAETRGDLAAHCLRLAERASPPDDPEVARSVASATIALRAMLARGGPAQMARDAAEGFRTASDDGPWRAYCRFLEGVACHLAGDPRRARGLLEDGIERAGRVAPSVHALCLAQSALVLLDEDEPVRALMVARRSRAVVEEWGLGSQSSSALAYGALALALAQPEHADESRANLREARRVLAETVDACAWLAVQTRVVIARAGIAIGEEAAAREELAAAERFLHLLCDAPALRDDVEQLSRQVQPVPEGDAACLSSITAAETRVLRLLPTHHSFREIGDLLFLSRFTVKSHAHALYRKLGVSGRSDAVERARQLRILSGPGP